ncbi:YlxR family protein [Tsukamurella spumae]|uniref:YlxR family protein n=1 Tax=Tsukamurella spumae TaxID=44753 RepID=A0A846X8S5_9ACTN|nr:YlxR family protein [Tsukamurella spumae]NKY20985.1 YlxR family protein [Tsukamurella spumae]
MSGGSSQETRTGNTEPVRTCIGCRGRAPAGELIRVVAVPRADGVLAVVVDARRRLPGRGAWLHDDQRCRELARKRNAFRRALRLSGPVDDTEVVR